LRRRHKLRLCRLRLLHRKLLLHRLRLNRKRQRLLLLQLPNQLLRPRLLLQAYLEILFPIWNLRWAMIS
jgi:hypothetical protein